MDHIQGSDPSQDQRSAYIDATATNTGANLAQYRVRLGFDDQPPDLLVGQSATALVTTAEATDTLYVRTSAVRPGPGDTYTVQVKDGSGPRTRTVQIGIRGDRYAQRPDSGAGRDLGRHIAGWHVLSTEERRQEQGTIRWVLATAGRRGRWALPWEDEVSR